MSDPVLTDPLTRVKGSDSWVTSVAYAPDGRTVLSGTQDGSVRLWDVESGVQLRCFEGHEDLVTSVAYAPDGRTVLSGAGDGSVRLWDAGSGVELRRVEGSGSWVASVAYAPDGRTVLSGAQDGSVWLWDVETGAVICEMVGLAHAWIVNDGDGSLRRHGGDIWRYVYALVEEGDTVRVVCPDETSLRVTANDVLAHETGSVDERRDGYEHPRS